MRKPGKMFGATIGALVLELPVLLRFINDILAAYTAPADAKSLGASVLEAVEAVAHWPLWMSILFSVGGIASYAIFLFGPDGLTRAWAFLSRRENRLARLKLIADDADLDRLVSAGIARTLVEKLNWEPYAPPPLPPTNFPPESLRDYHFTGRMSAAK